jgi:hypothetical protein
MARAAHRRDAARYAVVVVVDLQVTVKLATWAEAVLFEVKTLHYSDRSTTPGADGWYVRGSSARAGSEWCIEQKGKGSAGVPVDRAKDAQRLDHELWPDRQ